MSRTAVFVKLMRYSRPPRMSAYHDREHEQTQRSGCQGESQGRCHPSCKFLIQFPSPSCWECQSRNPLRVALVQEGAELAHLGCNRVVCQSCPSHGNHHFIQHFLFQRIKRCGDVKVLKNVVEGLMVIADGRIRHSPCGFRCYESSVNLFKCLPATLVHRDLLSHKNRPHPFCKIHKVGMRSDFLKNKAKTLENRSFQGFGAAGRI